MMHNVQCTLSVEKIPVVLRPVVKLSVKCMASIGTQEIRRKAEIYEFYRFWRNFDEVGQKLQLIFDENFSYIANITSYFACTDILQCAYLFCTIPVQN